MNKTPHPGFTLGVLTIASRYFVEVHEGNLPGPSLKEPGSEGW